MKLVNPKSLVALFLVIIVLIASLSYMSYNVVSTVPITKSPAEIIDSLKNELKQKELMILSLQKDAKPMLELVLACPEHKALNQVSLKIHLLEKINPK